MHLGSNLKRNFYNLSQVESSDLQKNYSYHHGS